MAGSTFGGRRPATRKVARSAIRQAVTRADERGCMEPPTPNGRSILLRPGAEKEASLSGRRRSPILRPACPRPCAPRSCSSALAARPRPAPTRPRRGAADPAGARDRGRPAPPGPPRREPARRPRPARPRGALLRRRGARPRHDGDLPRPRDDAHGAPSRRGRHPRQRLLRPRRPAPRPTALATRARRRSRSAARTASRRSGCASTALGDWIHAATPGEPRLHGVGQGPRRDHDGRAASRRRVLVPRRPDPALHHEPLLPERAARVGGGVERRRSAARRLPRRDSGELGVRAAREPEDARRLARRGDALLAHEPAPDPRRRSPRSSARRSSSRPSSTSRRSTSRAGSSRRRGSAGARRVDLLGISLSANDSVGHLYGPWSQEAQDHLARVDAALGVFLDFLEARTGGALLVALTADHGVLPLPEWEAAQGVSKCPVEGGRARSAGSVSPCFARLWWELGPWTRWFPRWLQFAEHARSASTAGSSRSRASRSSAPSRRRRRRSRASRRSRTPGPRTRSARAQGPFAELYRHSFVHPLSGDLVLQIAEGCLVSDFDTGTTHGSPYLYDRRVPVLFRGPGIEPGRVPGRAATIDIAPTLAARLGVPLARRSRWPSAPARRSDGSAIPSRPSLTSLRERTDRRVGRPARRARAVRARDRDPPPRARERRLPRRARAPPRDPGVAGRARPSRSRSRATSRSPATTRSRSAGSGARSRYPRIALASFIAYVLQPQRRALVPRRERRALPHVHELGRPAAELGARDHVQRPDVLARLPRARRRRPAPATPLRAARERGTAASRRRGRSALLFLGRARASTARGDVRGARALRCAASRSRSRARA